MYSIRGATKVAEVLDKKNLVAGIPMVIDVPFMLLIHLPRKFLQWSPKVFKWVQGSGGIEF